MKKILKLAYSV